MRDWLAEQRLKRVLTQDGNVDAIASDFRGIQRGNHEITRHTAGEASIRALQRALILLGYSTSVGGGFAIDGDFGRGTNRGLAQFRFDHDLPSVSRETLCYPCTFSTAHRLIVSIPDVPFDAPALERMADAVLEAVEAKRITFGDFDLALEHLNRLHGGRLMSCREILERYGELAAQAAETVFAESGTVVHAYWILAIIRQETAGVVRPRFEQHKLSRYAAVQSSEELAELRYRAMSLGLGQIMGNNYALVGAGSARAMMQSPIEDQVLFIGRFLARSRALRSSLAAPEPAAADFAKVARYYNGPGYAGHFYHESLERWFNELKSLAHEDAKPVPVRHDELIA